MKRILLVEDDALIAAGLVCALRQEGYEPTHCATVAAAYQALQTGGFELALLDAQLPDGTGFQIAEKLRGAATAVIFLTVVDDESRIVSAFENGAADYITKPFRLRELLARVKRTLAQTAGTANAHEDNAGCAMLGQLKIDMSAGTVSAGERAIELTALEYKLLLVFAMNPGRLLTRAQILEGIWDSGGNFVEDNTLTVYIKRLREKLGDAVNIETVRGLGYRAGQEKRN